MYNPSLPSLSSSQLIQCVHDFLLYSLLLSLSQQHAIQILNFREAGDIGFLLRTNSVPLVRYLSIMLSSGISDLTLNYRKYIESLSLPTTKDGIPLLLGLVGYLRT